ncbi:DUF1173 family protein [Thauera sp. 63]|uniref:DUF1173 family protein n=1 Tax=Thauera sp. 63 TaxID=497321 RepID=UPI0002CEAD7D|nr:DUF1173 family protein [Thauera sp. 63]ENO79146.1 hypothetical protein C664_05426 [Thauera sp. 63]
MTITDPPSAGLTAKQPGKGKTFPVQIGQDTYGVLAQTDPLKARFWQSILGRAKTAGTPVHCLCLRDDQARLLSVHERDGRYHLQAFPNQGESHAKECRFHRDATGPKNAFPETTDEPAQDEPPRDRLPMGFAMPTHSPSMGGAGAGGPRNSPRIHRVSLEYLLIKLWNTAGLNEWKPSWAGKRNMFTVLNRLRTAATEIEINGEQLAQNLVIGELHEGGTADAHNAAVIKRATEARRRILVLGRLAAAKRQDQGLTGYEAKEIARRPAQSFVVSLGLKDLKLDFIALLAHRSVTSKTTRVDHNSLGVTVLLQKLAEHPSL